MKHNPVNWFEIYVQDMARAKKFYESVFQLKLKKIDSPDTEMWRFPMDVERFGASGSLVKMEGVTSGGNSTMVYFICTDCAAEASRVTAPEDVFTSKRRPSVSTASLHWPSTPKAICSVCTQ